MYKALLLFHTVKFLKIVQIYYRLFYLMRRKVKNQFNIKYELSKESKSKQIQLVPSIPSYHSYNIDNQFIFLNLSKNFKDNINWNHSEYGKLWTYNLNYFEFLNQEKINKDEGLLLIEDFIDNIQEIKDGLEPFPISLRVINWIKFLSYHKISNKIIDNSLYAQCLILIDNLEYHLQGNHLLENAFALLFGSYYFEDEQLYNKAKFLLERELNEQILDDGGHFELSPMYHQLMLYRLLDSINLLQNNHNSLVKESLLSFLEKKASLMLGWLKEISYNNGDIPLLNDSAKGIAPHSNKIFSYAEQLKLTTKKIDLHSSGYRKFKRENCEVVIDVGEIGASYLAGHAHADTLNFELRLNNKEFIVDTGISTYQINEQRDIERATSAHNTVVINDLNSSQVWDGFRVANRANIVDLQESKNQISGTHNGYKKDSVLHQRVFQLTEKELIIKDTLSKKVPAQYFLHFHPDITEEKIRERVSHEAGELTIKSYQYPLTYNKLVPAYYILIEFNKELTTRINIENN